MSTRLMAEGQRLRRLTMDAYEDALRNRKPYEVYEDELLIRMDQETKTVSVQVIEYRAAGGNGNKEYKSLSTLKAVRAD